MGKRKKGRKADNSNVERKDAHGELPELPGGSIVMDDCGMEEIDRELAGRARGHKTPKR